MKDETSVDPLIVTHEAPIGWLVLNRPQVRNALNLRTWQRIAEGVAELASDDAIRVIVMRGSTPQAFIAGADISEFPAMRADAAQARAYRDAPNSAIAALVECRKPVIAMISGVCIGGGVQVALSCDIRIAARGTRFGVPAARLGLAYPLEGVNMLAHTVGPANARDILLSARLFDAEEALQMGLINRAGRCRKARRQRARLRAQNGDQRAADDVRRQAGDSREPEGPRGTRREAGLRDGRAMLRQRGLSRRRSRVPGKAPPGFKGR